MSLYMLAAAKYTEVADHSDIGVVVVTGLVLVFAVLILLYLLIALEGVVFSNLDKKKQQKAQGGADAVALPPKAAAPAPAPAVQVEAGIPGEVVAAIAAAEGAQVLPVCAKMEAEIAELDPEDKAMFLEELGVAESGLDRLIKASYALLGLISFLTSGEDECRAWTIKKGTKAPQAAGKIHSDFERGFIRAEVVSYEDLMACGTMAAAREKGLIRSEGKEYVVQDGDIILFRFNV